MTRDGPAAGWRLVGVCRALAKAEKSGPWPWPSCPVGETPVSVVASAPSIGSGGGDDVHDEDSSASDNSESDGRYGR